MFWVDSGYTICFVEVVGLSGYIPGVVFSRPKINEKGRGKAAHRTSVTFAFLRLISGSTYFSVIDS